MRPLSTTFTLLPPRCVVAGASYSWAFGQSQRTSFLSREAHLSRNSVAASSLFGLRATSSAGSDAHSRLTHRVQHGKRHQLPAHAQSPAREATPTLDSRAASSAGSDANSRLTRRVQRGKRRPLSRNSAAASSPTTAASTLPELPGDVHSDARPNKAR